MTKHLFQSVNNIMWKQTNSFRIIMYEQTDSFGIITWTSFG